MKKVTSRAGQVEFRLPDDWIVEPNGNGIQAYSPADESGTLRLDVLTIERGDDKRDSDTTAASSLRTMKPGSEPKKLPTGAWLIRYEIDSEEDGVPIHLTYWHLALVRGRFAFCPIFSYTLHKHQLDEPEHRSEIEMLDREIRAAVFK